ncbi:DUF3822 family protein [Parabacteroides sp. PF5-9]|uniref:DUF3822 family protein n=1 Tax=Parabacteroides sp. PF5-9 TaxID=1742404 RepID=UPI0024745D31|nr:DUF3822 family protein [Parabacteroides sp. PF5-9]MDH6356898.1 hypothetical protein [Parabacteroides sp. PF5-9]
MMTISIPDTLTIDNSINYIVSIRLDSDGLSFSGYSPSVGRSFFYRETKFNSDQNIESALKEFFFAHDFLTWMYKHINIIYVSPLYTLVPEELYDEKRKEELLNFPFSTPQKRCMHNKLKGKKSEEVLFGMDNEVFEFCSRSFIKPTFINHITPLLSYWKKESLSSPQRNMYVVLHDKMIDIIGVEQGKLLFVNSFSVEQRNEILYYVLYAWKQIGFNQDKDQLFLFGEPNLCNTLTKVFEIYIKYIHSVEIPSEAFLLGNEVAHAPMDLIALSVCEL